MSDIIDALDLLTNNGMSNVMLVQVAEDLLENDGFEDTSDAKIVALMIHTGSTDIEVSAFDDCLFSADGAEYLVLDEDEKDDHWDQSLESSLDEGCVEHSESPYFDRERWKNDARHDGAGCRLASYDGNEEEIGNYYIFRTN